jgi:uncharacterized protein (TIGR02145 family)
MKKNYNLTTTPPFGHLFNLLKGNVVAFFLLLSPFLLFAQGPPPPTVATNINVDISTPGQTTVTFDAIVVCKAVATLYYSVDKCAWDIAQTVTPGAGNSVIWDNAADDKFGNFYFKVEYSEMNSEDLRAECEGRGGVLIGCTCWAHTNLDNGGVFAANEYSGGAFYQWGRKTDGHEVINRNTNNSVISTSPAYPCNNTTNPNTVANGLNVTPLTSANLDDNGQPTGTVDASSATTCPDAALSVVGKFIKNSVTPYDWRDPQNNFLWNSNTDVSPVKTVNDPCPSGWRVPTEAELSSLIQTANVTRCWIPLNSDEYNNISGYELKNNPDNGSSLFLPAAGFRSLFANGAVLLVGTLGYYWSSGIDGTSGRSLSFDHGNLDMNLNHHRGNGYSVRCVAEP